MQPAVVELKTQEQRMGRSFFSGTPIGDDGQPDGYLLRSMSRVRGGIVQKDLGASRL
jgi:hypothetical protein